HLSQENVLQITQSDVIDLNTDLPVQIFPDFVCPCCGQQVSTFSPLVIHDCGHIFHTYCYQGECERCTSRAPTPGVSDSPLGVPLEELSIVPHEPAVQAESSKSGQSRKRRAEEAASALTEAQRQEKKRKVRS